VNGSKKENGSNVPFFSSTPGPRRSLRYLAPVNKVGLAVDWMAGKRDYNV